jgi:chromosome segregation protein
LAEVNLVFENNGTITQERFANLAEIMITRRLYRSGESDYLINKMPCRLKDIQQLLMDTGLGNRAYAIIEQGRVAAFIESRPEERRLWLEEAAGITRYKNQKKVSLRKLDQAKDNMDRLNDIILEVETQMKRLERQAKKAQRYQNLRKKIRDLDLNVASHEFRRLHQEIQAAESEADAVGAQLLLANQRVTGLETDLETIKVQLVSAEQEIAQAGERELNTKDNIQKAENEISLFGRQAEDQRNLASRYSQERDELSAKLQEFEQQLARARSRSAKTQERLAQSRQAVEEATELLQNNQNALEACEQQVDHAKQALVDHLSRSTQLHNRTNDLERQQTDLDRRRQSVQNRRSDLDQEIRSLKERTSNVTESLHKAKKEQEDLQNVIKGLEHHCKSCSGKVKELGRVEQEATRRRHEVAAAVDALELGLSSYEWAQSGVRKVLTAAEKGELEIEILGVVADQLRAEPGQEAMVEAALGPDLQALVVKSGAAARNLAAWAQDKGLGRLRVLALDDLSAWMQQNPTGTSPLTELVRPRQGFEPLAALAAGIGTCGDVDAAWATAQSMQPGQAVISSQGQRLDRPGSIQAGGDQGQSVLTRHNELSKRRQQLQAAEEDLTRARQARSQAEDQLSALEQELDLQKEQSAPKAAAVNQQEQDLFRLQEAQALKIREMEGLEFDAVEVQNELERLEQEQEQLQDELGLIEDARLELEGDLTRAQAALAQARQELDAIREQQGEARLSEASLASQAEHDVEEVKRLEQEFGAIQERAAGLVTEINQARQKMESLLSRRQEEQQRLAGLYEELDQQEQAYRRAREIHSQAQMNLADLENSLKQARSEQRQVENTAQNLDFRKRELVLQSDHLCQDISERCRVDLTIDHENYLPQDAFDPESARENLAKLRQRLARLGPVNLEAITEHEALSERWEFLSNQKEDLEASIFDLRLAIRKINKTSRTRFNQTLADVNERLREIFPVLFTGGQAQLVTDENVDPLEAGLHLMVELPGKKLRSLQSLSGGEKALAAVAVLFALFLIRPAPFCILDEVDAPLDEANINRFHELLKKLAQHSQIILITHSRRTMEIMDLLYGVTMEEKGVSKILAVSLNRGQSMAA